MSRDESARNSADAGQNATDRGSALAGQSGATRCVHRSESGCNPGGLRWCGRGGVFFVGHSPETPGPEKNVSRHSDSGAGELARWSDPSVCARWLTKHRLAHRVPSHGIRHVPRELKSEAEKRALRHPGVRSSGAPLWTWVFFGRHPASLKRGARNGKGEWSEKRFCVHSISVPKAENESVAAAA